ncbi:uncharacterized protein LOC126977191 [Leptidea sinapis]|uniref:uncharacterized protein LOC126977191 n=1 Tax=Leptidea sinapis TaxID=189913 RepID=UPI0021C2C4EA|nr:uncharacterized protein LOC126977191 [Leptidea sinapis]
MKIYTNISKSFLIFFLVVLTLCGNSNGYNVHLPNNWPSPWSDGIIPFTFNYFSLSPRRLISVVRKGLDHIQERSCLRFIERDPMEVSRIINFTYLFFSYSDALESCCLEYFTMAYGRRLTLITPRCMMPAEVAHATLHAMGLNHSKHSRFDTKAVESVLFPISCDRGKHKYKP